MKGPFGRLSSGSAPRPAAARPDFPQNQPDITAIAVGKKLPRAGLAKVRKPKPLTKIGYAGPV